MALDTIYMEEDCVVEGNAVTFPVGLKSGSNRRLQGEDVKAGDIVLAKGARLRPQENWYGSSHW